MSRKKEIIDYSQSEASSIMQGTFTSHARGFGFVHVEGRDQDIFIPRDQVMGAFHGDTVEVRVWQDYHIPGLKPEGSIIRVIERGHTNIIGTVIREGKNIRLLPDDTHIPVSMEIWKKDLRNAVTGDKVLAHILSYGTDHRPPRAKVVRVLGKLDDPRTDVPSVLYTYGIETAFPMDTAEEAEQIPDRVSKEDLAGRKDFRHKLTVTIDGEDAKDLDDAITLERTDSGYELGVHIADVSHYVGEGTPLDREALKRGTSVYLVDTVVPMLPRKLSNGICSLNQGQDRLTLSCIMRLDAAGNMIDHEIVEGVIRVDRRLSYTGVQAILDADRQAVSAAGNHTDSAAGDRTVSGAEGQTVPDADRAIIPNGEKRTGKNRHKGFSISEEGPKIRELCFLMEELAALLKEKRRIRGSVDFDFPESKIILDRKGFVEDIVPYERNTAMDIIEDFMLLANETVAEDYYWQELPFVYRNHEAPDPAKLKKLDHFIRNFGYYLRTERDDFHPKEIQKLLFSLEGKPEEGLISRMTLRSMQRARYSSVNQGHFGLSTRYYTHFTSPIRRYPDLQIHRIIKESLHGQLTDDRISHYEQILPDVTDSSSALERRAQEAERDVEKLKKVEFMEQHLQEPFAGVISGVTAAGLFVELANSVEGMIPMRNLIDDYYHYDEDGYCLIGEDSGKKYSLGQTLRVLAVHTDKMRKTIDFMLADSYEEFLLEYDRASWDRDGWTDW